jgi:hypothetical protein
VTTSTNSWGLGFTGGTAALVKAADGTVIWASELCLAGVDAKSVFWGRSSRVDKYWNEWVPSDKLSQADSLEFVLGHNPHDRWAEDWKKFGDGVGQAAASVVGHRGGQEGIERHQGGVIGRPEPVTRRTHAGVDGYRDHQGSAARPSAVAAVARSAAI